MSRFGSGLSSFAKMVFWGALIAATLLFPPERFAPTEVEAQTAAPVCSAQRMTQLGPTDPQLCAELDAVIRKPGALPLSEYESKLGEFLRNYCHRNPSAGWKPDKRMRDTGPYIATLDDGVWSAVSKGTHAPVVIWYSKEMIDWLRVNRPVDGSPQPDPQATIPDGAVMIKEMFSPPTGPCADVDPLHLYPENGAAVMVRDNAGSQDGWFWGWFGWSGWSPDWPAGAKNSYPNMGFGQYCVNCHASSEHDSTFASLRNIAGEPGEPLVFLSQGFFPLIPEAGHHRLVTFPTDDAPRLGQPTYPYNPAFARAFPAGGLPAPTWETVSRMPSETYDNVWAHAGDLTASSQFLTSDQCLGCHDAGSTGLQFDMTLPNPHGTNLLNLSPYATWRTSPMGLGGRDPVFYAQLASEIDTFHPSPEDRKLIQDVCLGCHGVQGQRQYHIDRGECGDFPREYARAAPWPLDNPLAGLANYGALARDGISCMSCHHMVLGKEATAQNAGKPWNRCVKERQDLLNPDNDGFALTFTGSFLVGPPDQIYGPFEDPKVKPMKQGLGIEPVHNANVSSSELCGTCHTVHLPVLYRGKIIDHVYEQTTYPEWAFSAYRTGTGPDGALPQGPGERHESCQSCHMPSKDSTGKPYLSKIASIQEFSNFPEAEYNLGPADIDLKVREGFARHTLVGLNVFFIKIAQQFPDVLGIRTQDPMLVGRGLDPLLLTEQAMLDQASTRTAKVSVTVDPNPAYGKLKATVEVENLAGHKFPSGVGFRRAFLEFEVLDENGDALWVSGRTNGAGVLVDESGNPVPGELWWKDDCSGLLNPDQLVFQPHYQTVTRQDQVQIYQELVTAPAPVDDPQCGSEAAAKRGQFTTSFLSICGQVKDNRLLPHGLLPFEKRLEIATALGAGEELAKEVGSHGIDRDPDYLDPGRAGKDALSYEIALSELKGKPAKVRATLYYQATPPYFLQDRFCTSQGVDTQRLYFLAGHLNLEGTQAQDWKLKVVGSGSVGVP